MVVIGVDFLLAFVDILMNALAAETIDAIIDYLHSDRSMLFACSLTSKRFLPCSRYHIFSQVHVRPTNIVSFLQLAEAPCSSLTSLMPHLLINGFSAAIVKASDCDAMKLLERVTSLLSEVKQLRIINSSKVKADHMSALKNVRHLEISMAVFELLDDALDLVYAFPLLKSLSFGDVSVSLCLEVQPFNEPHIPV